MNRTLELVAVVPVYNEALVLEKAVIMLVDELKRQLSYGDWQVMIASNGSDDGTDEIGRHLEREMAPYVKLVVCSQKGRGRALREVFGLVKAKRYLYIDVDLPCELSDLANVLAPLDEGVDLVTSRRTGYRPPVRRAMTIGLRVFNLGLFGLIVSDSQCAVKALSPRAATVLVEDCRQDAWYLDTELIVLGAKCGLRRMEVPIHWVERRFPGRDSKVEAWGDGVKALRSLGQIWRRRSELNKG